MRRYRGIYSENKEKGAFVAALKAVFFDLDGLLADTEALHVFAYEAVGRYLKLNLDRGYICSFIGGPTRENIKRVMRDYNIAMDRFEEILKVRYDSYMEAIQNTVLDPMDGSLECIISVKNRSLKTALVTSSIRRHALAVLDNLARHSDHGTHLTSLFDTMVFGDELEHLKPAPDMYLEALKRLDTAPENAIVLEDSTFGVLAAKAAGLRVIAVPGPHTDGQDFSIADEVASSLHEVLEKKLIA
jgi:HAD superfamily hydrolase (TIGR01509 family)